MWVGVNCGYVLINLEQREFQKTYSCKLSLGRTFKTSALPAVWELDVGISCQAGAFLQIIGGI